jgi:peptidoglycan/xylan/chitin deacetylase (PgdA/CDA1 family)
MKSKIYNTVRKIIYSVTYLTSFVRREKLDGVILCYHSIADDGWEFSVPPKNFVKQIDYLLQKYQPCTLDEFAKYLVGEITFAKPFFVVTFDDGYKNIYQTKDYLKSKHIQPTVFLLSDTKNAHKNELKSNYRFLSNTEIKSLKQAGWYFGSHGATHADFWGLSKNDLKSEIITSKANLEEKLGFDIKYFAYPRGRYNEDAQMVVKRAGYDMAFSMDSRIMKRDVNKYTLPRVGVMGTHSFLEFKALLLPLSTRVRNILQSRRNL